MDGATDHLGDVNSLAPLFAANRADPAKTLADRDSSLIKMMIDACPVALCAVRADRIIEYANPAFRALSRRHAALAHGYRVAPVNTQDSHALGRAIEAAIKDHTSQNVRMQGPGRQSGLQMTVNPLKSSPARGSIALLSVVPQQKRALDSAQLRQVLQMKWDLSPREADSAILLSHGKAAKIIAQERGVSLPTIRTQLQAIREKLGVKSSLEAAAMITREGRGD